MVGVVVVVSVALVLVGVAVLLHALSRPPRRAPVDDAASCAAHRRALDALDHARGRRRR